jgi:hypothetical protein
MGNIASNATFTITFNAEVYEKIISQIPERVDTLIKNINEDNKNFEQANMELICRRFINRVVNDNLRFLSKLDDTYIAGLSVGLTAYIQTLELLPERVNESKSRELIVDYVKRIVSIINTQQKI